MTAGCRGRAPVIRELTAMCVHGRLNIYERKGFYEDYEKAGCELYYGDVHYLRLRVVAARDDVEGERRRLFPEINCAQHK